jgi:phenylacetate-CoA ligase
MTETQDLLAAIRAHPSAPGAGFADADPGLTPPLLEKARAFSAEVEAVERDQGLAAVILRESVAATIARARASTSHYGRTLASAHKSAELADVPSLPTVGREALAAALPSFVPHGEDLGPLVATRTSGTTGPALVVPQHPVSLAAYAPLLRAAMARRRIDLALRPGALGVVLVEAGRPGAPRSALGAHPLLSDSAFLRLALGDEWRRPDDPSRLVAAFAPSVIAGTPAAFEELMTRAAAGAGVRMAPRALVYAGSFPGYDARQCLEKAFGGAPVVDWYGAAEVGPIAYGCRTTMGLHLLTADLLVEVLEPEGEIAVTCGRNPYLPLVRYRPGDRCRIDRSGCPCGDASPRLLDIRRV